MPIYSLAHLLIMCIFAFLIGASIGSFLNVCILRIPRKIALSLPGSHCFSCGTSLGASENVPILGYFLLKGKCKHCGTTFSFQYAWVEILTAIFSVFAFFLSIKNAYSFSAVFYVFEISLFSILLVAAVIDYRHSIIPDQITIPFFVFYSLFHIFFSSSLINSSTTHYFSWYESIALLILLLCFAVYYFISHVETTLDIVPKLNSIFLFLLAFFLITLFVFFPEKYSSYLQSVFNSLAGAFFCGGVLYVLIFFFKFLRLPDILGEGDSKLFLAVGAFFGNITSYHILVLWLYITAMLASISIYMQARKKVTILAEKYVGGIFLFIMIIGISLIGLSQFLFPNRYIFLSGVILFLSTSYVYFLLTKKWSDQKIVEQSFPMGSFIMIATLIYLIYQVQITEKYQLILSFF